jgi:hypothetical protein
VSWPHVIAVRELTGLDQLARHVLLVYATYADDDGHAWPAAGTVAAAVGCAPVTVSRALERIEAATAVTVTRRMGRSALINLADLAPLERVPPRALGISTSRSGNGTSRSGNENHALLERDEPRTNQLEPCAVRNPTIAALVARADARGNADRQLTMEELWPHSGT